MCDPEPPDTGQPSGTAAAFIARRQSNKEHDFKAVKTCQSLEQERLYRFIKHRHCLDGTVAFNITKATLNPSHPCRNPLVKPRWLHQRQAQGTGDEAEESAKSRYTPCCTVPTVNGMTVNRDTNAARIILSRLLERYHDHERHICFRRGTPVTEHAHDECGALPERTGARLPE
ncbi:hypothetical protein EDD86DRAFT_114036 [Gorgonomyces haynaldii]|nr:hypothetical protein EDD86DRAFT_114036 [Gorgonomyces haynaldii]